MNLTYLARKLRRKQTEEEHDLWYYLRNKRLNGLKFKRQQQIGSYIVDFVCIEKRIIIELDGSQHLENKEKDKKRDAELNQIGYKVIRFDNNEFNANKESVVEYIANQCLNQLS